ncbi:uncharacterized protein ARMOST_22434 [Armillaria ostoyae]|uniref:Uncharacterized protein n=1 Tax=Armillaria ostoyae TaxID=47428 RepID=A0A284SCV1_ARMOS|nr:uncharacterized protein ARMOST_22434 [Armillaria ostoyae]
MSTKPRPVTLARLLRHSQTAHRQPDPVVENNTPPAVPEPRPNPTTNAEPHESNVNPSPLFRLTAAGIYPPPSHTTANPSTTLPQPYVRPAPAVAGLLSHAFNPNAFLGQLPQPGATAFVGSNTTGRQKASILRMTLGDRQAPICHIIIYPFVSPHHRIQAAKNNDPHIQRAYALPESDIYNLEETDVESFRAHMQKLDLCVTYRTTSNDTYKDIHAQLLAHNADSTKPHIPGLKTENLDHLTFDNMGWCFLHLATRGPNHALLTFNKNHKEMQSNVSYMIQYGSLESKFNAHCKRKNLAMPGQFTIVIAPTTAPICHNLLNRNLYVGDYGPNGIPDAARNGVHACFAERAMHNLSFVMRRWGGSSDENALPCLRACRGLCPDVLGGVVPIIEPGIPRCPAAFVNTNQVEQVEARGPLNRRSNKHAAPSRSPSPHRAPLRPLSPIRRPDNTLPPLPLPPPYYAGEVWPEPQSAENARAGQFHTFFTQLVDPIDTFGDDALILKGPDVHALADAVITLSLYYAEHGWNDLNQGFVRYMNDPLGPEFSSPGITCDNWNEPARFGRMKIVLDGTGSHGDGINKMVFREALRRALADTDRYVSMPNNSSYFTANFPMTGCTKREMTQWRAQGLLLAACAVTFRMLPLLLSPFLFLALILEKTQLPGVLDTLSGPVIKALDPACEHFMQPWLGRRLTEPLTSEPPSNWGRDQRYLWVSHFCEPHLTALEVTPDLEKSILQNRLVLRLILLSHPLAEQSEAFNAMQQGFTFNFRHASYVRGLLSLFKLRYPTVHRDPNELLEYLDGIYDRKIHSTEDLMKVIDIQYGEVATDPFCSQRLDLGFGKDHNGDDLPLYMGIKRALEQSFRTYFQQDLTRHGERFLVMATSLPYMPCVGSEVKINLQRPGYTDMLSQTFRSNTCFSLVKIKLDMNLCRLLAGQSTDVFPNFTACLDFWLFDDTNIVTIV